MWKIYENLMKYLEHPAKKTRVQGKKPRHMCKFLSTMAFVERNLVKSPKISHGKSLQAALRTPGTWRPRSALQPRSAWPGALFGMGKERGK